MKTKRSKKKRIIFCTTVLVFCVGTGIFLVRKIPATKKSTPVVKNNAIALERMDLNESISATGTLSAKNSKSVSANLNGLTIRSVKYEVGDTVKKGDTLVTFDVSELQEALTDAKEELSLTTEEVNQTVSDAETALSDANSTYSDSKSSAESAIKKTKANVTSAKKKVQSLKKQLKKASAAQKQAIKEQLTAAKNTLEQAKNTYDEAVSQKKNTEKQNRSGVANASSSLKKAQNNRKKTLKEANAKVSAAQEALDNASITAPISGTITVINVQSGDVYNGETIMQIDNTDSFVVSTTVDEYDISNVEKGQKAIILTEATNEDNLEGTVTFVAPSAGSSVSSSQNSNAMSASSSSDGYEVQITLNDTDERLKIGMTAKCSIILSQAEDVYAVPYDAIHKNDQKQDVIYVTDDADDTENYDEIVVTKGLETDYYVEISSDSLTQTQNLYVIIPTDETVSPSSGESSDSDFSFPMGGNSDDGTMRGGGFQRNNGSGNGGSKGMPNNAPPSK